MVKVRLSGTATEANWHGVAHMLENDYLADVPIIIAAIDPCYSCTDRAFVIRQDDGAETCWDWQRLREYSMDWYKKRGLDMRNIEVRG